jgi:predicted Zn finger-like uncharacterized protein
MADEQFTCCPGCRTVYRVTPQQLAMRGGNVRCGHCHAVFDGVAQLVSLAPRPRPDEDDEDTFDELALGPPTVTLRDARGLDAPSPRAPESKEVAPESQSAAEVAARTEAFATSTRAPSADDAAAPARRERGRWATVLSAAAVPVLALAFVGQLAYHFRDSLAVRVPAARPILTELCRVAGCTVGAPREIADLVIGSSDLQADPAHQGLLILTATVRNRADIPLAYPYLEVALTNGQDQIVVRRALAPAEYAGGTADLNRGIPANSEISIKLFIDASTTTQAGYRLYLFYI